MPAKPSPERHAWRFDRVGGVDQVRLDRGADLVRLHELDQKLWVALSCPAKGLEFDERTLALLDTDGDGHVRPPELIAASRWLGEVLADPDVLVAGNEGLPLAAIDAGKPEGKRLLASAKHILAGLGSQAQAITVADTEKTEELFAKARRNGDGIVAPGAVEDAAARKVFEEIVATVGGVADRSGALGAGRAQLEKFFAECAAYADWRAKGEAAGRELLPAGEATGAAAAALHPVQAKVDDYFTRCRLAAYEPRAQAALNREEASWLEVAAKELSIAAAEVRHLPLARVEAGRALPLAEGVNPAWTEEIARLRSACVAPLLGAERAALTEAEWRGLCARLAPYRAWQAAKSGAAVEALGLARVRELLAGGLRAQVEAELDADLAVAPQVDAIAAVARLVRYVRDFHALCNNFVCFADFYARRWATFQAGTLYLDGRSCDLCVHVNDPAKHATLATMAKTYLVYCDCTRPGGAKATIACAFTAGNADNIFVGRNGVFYDRKGRDWDATVARIVDHPISLGQAFLAPYKKLVRFVEEQVARRAAAADAASTAKLESGATAAGAAAGGAPAARPKIDIGVVAAIGVAIGGITAAFSALLNSFFGLGLWMPIGVVGLILLISGPAMVIAWLKLRQRNLGPILDANGWAVNTLAKVNMPLGASLTARAALPAGAVRSLKDPYAPKRSAWPKVVLLLLLLAGAGYGAWRTGNLHRWWPRCPLPPPAAAEPAPAEAAPEGT